MMYTSDDRWFFTADRSRVVREGDPAAAFLYAAVGQRVPMEDAERYGIVERIVDAVADAVTETITETVVGAIEDAVEWIGDQIIDALDGDDDATDPAAPTETTQGEPEADVPSIDAPVIETPSQPVIETKPITRKRNRR